MTIIDARGLSCPQPVLMTKEALDQAPESCQIWVDAAAARGNVTRFAEKAGYRVEVSQGDGYYILTLSK